MAANPLSVVAVVGSLQAPSKTEALVNAVVEELAAAVPISTHFVRLSDSGPVLGAALNRAQLPAAAEEELQRIEQADVLVVGSPVYKGSFTGLFKHLFDLVDQYALAGTPVLLTATGGSERHSLILEHQLRPLFGFFQSLVLPSGVYGASADFDGYRLRSPLLLDRISLAVQRALPLISAAAAADAASGAAEADYSRPVPAGWSGGPS